MEREYERKGGRMGNKKTIYTIGDSHAWHCWLKIQQAATYTAGPMTMYHFGHYKPIMTGKMPMDGIVCFCWGEIDCRCHVYKHPPFEECIDKLVEEYLSAIDVNVAGRDPKNVWIYNVVPPPRRDPPQKYLVPDNPGFPFLGNDHERLSFVQRMNKRLSESKYTFVDVYSKYSDEEGFLKMEMSDGHVHIADEKPLKEWIDAHT